MLISRRDIRRSIRGYVLLPHVVPIAFVLATTAALTILATDGSPSPSILVPVLLAMLGGQIAIGAINEVVDAEIDARVKPFKPIPAGLVSRRGALTMAGLGLGAMMWFGAQLGWDSLALCAIGTGVGIAYSLWFKRTVLAWLPYLIALPLLPIWVFVAIGSFEARLLMLYPLGAFAVIAVHLAQSLPDVAADRAAGIRNLTAVLGERRAFVLCWGAVVASAVVAAVAATALGDSVGIPGAAGVVVATLCLSDVVLYRFRSRTGVMACFPCVGASVAILGLGWVFAVAR